MRKYLGMFLVLGIVILMIPNAYAQKVSLSVGPYIQISDNPEIEEAVGVRVKASVPVADGIAAETELTMVNSDIGQSMTVAELQQTALFGNVVFDLPAYKAIQPQAFVGIGVIRNDLDSEIPGVDMDADYSLAGKAGLGLLWNVHSPDAGDDGIAKGVTVNLYARAEIGKADADIEVEYCGNRMNLNENDLDWYGVEFGAVVGF